MSIRDDIANYTPYNEQEARDRELILHEMETNPLVFSRESERAHITASAWVVNRSRSKALIAYHNIYNSWSWLGGHADGEQDLLSVALREVSEESGLACLEPVKMEIFSIEVLAVNGHIKRGEYVSSHLHLNVTYLIEADESETLTAKPDENKAVAWFPLDEAVAKSNEEWFRENIYKKLNEKLRALSEK